MSEKLSLDGEVHELKLGRSFDADGSLSFHSMYYDFKPASIDTAQPAVIDIEQGNKVKVTVPHVEGSSTKQTVYCGSKQPSQKDFALIINHQTGEFVLERLTYRLNLKRSRSEKAREVKPSVIKQEMPASEAAKETKVTNVLPTTTEVKQEQPTKASKVTKRKSSTAVRGSVTKKSLSKFAAKQVLSSSSSSSNDSSTSSSSDSDDELGACSESEDKKPQSASAARSSQPSKSASNSNGNFNICDDLQLSESGSSSDSD